MLLPTRVPWPILSGEPWAPPTCLSATSLVLPGSSPFSPPRAPPSPTIPWALPRMGPGPGGPDYHPIFLLPGL